LNEGIPRVSPLHEPRLICGELDESNIEDEAERETLMTGSGADNMVVAKKIRKEAKSA